jgi:hypothetical protein
MGETVAGLFWWVLPAQLMNLTAPEVLNQWEMYPKAELLWDIPGSTDHYGRNAVGELQDRFGGFRDP